MASENLFKTLLQVLQTQFLNVGLKKGLHHTSWIGKSVYCTLEPEKRNIDGRNCPICNKRLRPIYYTGDKEKMLMHGFDNYISKPIDINILEQTIKKYI